MNWETNDGLLRSLESAIRKAIVDGLPFDRPTTTELEKASLSELLFWFGCWRARRIARQPRMVHWSGSLLYSRKRAVYAAELSVIAQKFAGGDDLNPHLSRSAGRAHVPGQPSTGFPADSEVDRMLSDWGVHHLHLSNSLSSNGFTMRTRDLLFCCVTRTDVYFIGIYDHRSWTDQQMVEVIFDNWPDAGLIHVSSTLSLEQEPTNAERLELRRAGVHALTSVRGRAAMTRGMSILGSPLDVVEHANQLIHELWRFDQEVLQSGVSILDSRFDVPPTRLSAPAWEPYIGEEDPPVVGLFDPSVDHLIQIGSLARS